MATTLYLVKSADAAPDTHLATNNVDLIGNAQSWNNNTLSTTRGAGVTNLTSSTVAGPTPGVDVGPAHWISLPVSADVTISGTITANIWAQESNMSANAAINVIIEIIRANATGTQNSNTLVEIVRSTRITELGFSGANTVQNFTTGMTSGGYTSQTLNRGDRLRVRVFADDAGTMASGFTFTVGFSGPTAAADGDTFITFTETFSFESETTPAGSKIYLTNTQPSLTGSAPTSVTSFTGSDETPLSEGGTWAGLDSAISNLRRISNQVGASTNLTGTNYSYYNVADYGPDFEAYVTLATLDGSQLLSLVVRIQSPGGTNQWDGYRISATTTTVTISRVTNNSTVSALVQQTQSWSAGDKLGVRCTSDGAISAYRQASGGSDWTLLCTAIDNTFGTTGKIGLGVANTTARIDDLFAANGSVLLAQQAWTSRGSGVVNVLSPTATGWTSPLFIGEWYTKPLQALTLTGLAQGNIRASESNAAATASLRLEVARVDGDGTNATIWATWCRATTSIGSAVAEVATTEGDNTVWLSGDDLAITDGQRLRIRVYIEDDCATALVSGHTVATYFAGTSGGASGDTYVIFPQTLTEFVSSPATLVLQPGFVNFNDPGVL